MEITSMDISMTTSQTQLADEGFLCHAFTQLARSLLDSNISVLCTADQI